MKTLLLLLLVAGSAVGQEYYRYPTGDTTFGSPVYVQVQKSVGRGMFLMIALDLWDEWRDSCWADSTVDTVADWSEGAYMTDPPMPVAGYRYPIVHRNPNDLPGFMEFIRRRTK